MTVQAVNVQCCLYEADEFEDERGDGGCVGRWWDAVEGEEFVFCCRAGGWVLAAVLVFPSCVAFDVGTSSPTPRAARAPLDVDSSQRLSHKR